MTQPASPLTPSAPACRPLGLYLHVPFCVRKCRYCSFVSIASSDASLHEAYVEAVRKEIAAAPALLGPSAPRHPLDTVFFGGGTPSLLTADQLGRILKACRDAFDDGRGAFRLRQGFGGQVRPRPDQGAVGSGAEAPFHIEITLEANPGTIDRAKLAALRAAGFNRLSLGAQTFDEDALRLLGRIHSAREIEEGVRAARAAGFDNVSLDLIFALPGQTLEQWKADLRAAAGLGVEHVSGYLLQLDDETPLAAAVRRGEVRLPDDELQKEMLLCAADALGAAGLARYEISNYAKPGFECRHNIKYWTGAPYLGFGPAAHSFVPACGRALRAQLSPPQEVAPGGGSHAGPQETSHGGVSHAFGLRWSNVPNVDEYIRRIRAGHSPVATRERLTREQRMFETVFLGLRMARGVDLAAFAREFEEDFDARHGATAERLAGQGLLDRADGFLRLTRIGLPVADSVMAEFASRTNHGDTEVTERKEGDHG